jgi:hypothetical protein
MFRLRLGLMGLAIFLLATGWLAGQDQKSDDKKTEDKEVPAKVKGNLPKGFSKLGLTDDQKQSIYKITGKYRAKIDELRQKMIALQTEEKAEIDKVLTAEQKARLREILLGDFGKDTKDKAAAKDKDESKKDK